jgi:hypothetical protein
MCRTSPVAPDGSVRVAAHTETDLGVEPLPLPVLHGDVAGERVEQLDVAVGVVDALPVEVPGRRHSYSNFDDVRKRLEMLTRNRW